MTAIQAHYGNWSGWDLDELDIDITKVHDWYIKYDCLRIQREENGEWEKFRGDSEHFDYKRPEEITIGNNDDYLTVENGESIKGGAL
jgi:hypothetical protein